MAWKQLRFDGKWMSIDFNPIDAFKAKKAFCNEDTNIYWTMLDQYPFLFKEVD